MKQTIFNTLSVLVIMVVGGCAGVQSDASGDLLTRSVAFKDKTMKVAPEMTEEQVKAQLGQPDSFITMDKYILSRMGASQALVYDHPARGAEKGGKWMGEKDDQFLIGLDAAGHVTSAMMLRPAAGLMDRPKLFSVDEYWRSAGRQGQARE